jgi:UDP-N-acetylglucosamine--N-acetylmuramyl-(pentapeptide) pyrophosphoryl-undecaprenol N-acetylglucosamine transferase
VKGKSIIIAAGGTGGHVFPGIAVAEEIKSLAPDVRIVFAGTERGLESSIVPKHGWPLKLFGSRSIKDKGGAARVAAIAMLPFSVIHAIAMLISDRPSLVVSIGGYAAGPLVLAAWVLRIPVVLVEPNAIAGMTNRKLGRLAKKVFVAFDEAKRYFPNGRAILTGAPIRTEVLSGGRRGPTDVRTLFVFGGSQGAMTLNRAMMAAAGKLGGLGGRLRVIHQTGTSADPAEVARTYSGFGIEADVRSFCDRIWECYEDADLVIARSGANTVAELAALGLPSILVPYPYAADDHQRANAMALVRAGGARVIDDSECDGERMAREIADVLGDDERLRAMAEKARSIGRPDAARRIAKECIELIK